jgi:hypothetical protein
VTTRLNAARSAIGDSGEEQRLIKTLPRKGFRFVGTVLEEQGRPAALTNAAVEPTKLTQPPLHRGIQMRSPDETRELVPCAGDVLPTPVTMPAAFPISSSQQPDQDSRS